MLTFDKYDWYNNHKNDNKEQLQTVLENNKAMVIYNERSDEYIAISKEIKGSEYSLSGNYVNSTKGNFKRCRKAFEKYSGFVRA